MKVKEGEKFKNIPNLCNRKKILKQIQSMPTNQQEKGKLMYGRKNLSFTLLDSEAGPEN